MPEHQSKNTVSATYWCAKCHKQTLHRVDDGRRGACYTCMETPLPLKPEPPEATQLELGDVYGTFEVK